MNDRLRDFRMKQGMSIQEMSEYIGVSKSAYEKVEYAQRTPSYNFVKKFKSKYPQSNTDLLFFANVYTQNVWFI